MLIKMKKKDNQPKTICHDVNACEDKDVIHYQVSEEHANVKPSSNKETVWAVVKLLKEF